MHDQHEVGAGRHAIALLNGVVARHARLERVLLFVALPLERDLDDRVQAVAQDVRELVGIDDRDLARDHAGVAQALHAPQARGWRDVHPGRQLLVRQRRILLELVQKSHVDGV